MLGWAVDVGPGLPAERIHALEESLRRFAEEHEGWVALAHGTMPSLDALSVRVGVVVASVSADSEAAAGIADEGYEEGDDDLLLLDATELDDASLKFAKQQFAGGKKGALARLNELDLSVYDVDKPSVWLVVTGGTTRAVVQDAMEKKHFASAEGDPRALKLPRGAHRLAAF